MAEVDDTSELEQKMAAAAQAAGSKLAVPNGDGAGGNAKGKAKAKSSPKGSGINRRPTAATTPSTHTPTKTAKGNVTGESLGRGTRPTTPAKGHGLADIHNITCVSIMSSKTEMTISRLIVTMMMVM